MGKRKKLSAKATKKLAHRATLMIKTIIDKKPRNSFFPSVLRDIERDSKHFPTPKQFGVIQRVYNYLMNQELGQHADG